MNEKKKEVRTLQSRNGQPRIMKPIFTSLQGSMSKTKESTAKKRESQNSLSSLKTRIKDLPDIKEKQELHTQLPLLVTTDADHIDELFKKKLRLCFLDRAEDQQESTMREILTVMNDKSMKIAYKLHCDDIVTLLACRMYRTPKECPREWYSPSDFYFSTDIIEQKDWLRASLVYDIGITYFKRNLFDPADDQVLKHAGDLMKLAVYLSRTCDDKEQNKLVYLFLEMYQNIPKLRKFALNVIKSSLHRVLYDNDLFVLAKPLLKMLAPIVAGFRTPVKKQYIHLFTDVILPLHRNPYFAYFKDEMLTVVLEFAEKENAVVIALYEYLMRYWPRMQPQKQMVFMSEIGWLSSFVDNEDINKAVHILAPQLMASLNGCHAAVSESVLRLWEINDFVWMTTQNAEVSYPILLPRIFETASTHWHLEVRSVATAVLNILRENNPRVFDAVGVYLKRIESNRVVRKVGRAEKWTYLISIWDGKKSEKKAKMKCVTGLFVG